MIHLFPTNFVAVDNEKFDDALIDGLLSDVDFCASRINYVNNVKTDYGSDIKPWIHGGHGLLLMKTLLPSAVSDILLSIYNRHVSNAVVTDAWFADYEKGGLHHPHTHANSDVSAILILRSTDRNKTVFFQHGNLLTESVFHAEDASVGSLLVFPSLLGHYVMPAESRRTIISANLRITFSSR